MTRRKNTIFARSLVVALVVFLSSVRVSPAAAQNSDRLSESPVMAVRAFGAFGAQPGALACCHGSISTGVEIKQDGDVNSSDWASFDKLQHVTFSFLVTVGTQYTLVNKLDVSSKPATPVSAATGLSVGIAKELYDRRFGRSGRFDFRDLVADVVGVLLATGLILI